MARVDVNILKEIARIVQSRAKVPDRIQLQKRTFLITYLDDHRRRIEEALRRHDSDRLNMLFGQLESKVKYQVIRRTGAATLKHRAARPSQPVPRAKAVVRAKPSAAKAGQKKQTARHGASPQSKRPATVRKKASRTAKMGRPKPAPKRQSARKRGR